MLTPHQPGRLLRHARQQFLDHGEMPPPELVGTVVARSWRRCLDAGLNPAHRFAEPLPSDILDIAQATERRQELVAHALPVMQYVQAQTRDSGSMVILADDRGMLIRALGDADFLHRADRVALAPGMSWNEVQRGTNAIGTAVAEQAPVVVHGFEHFLERNGFLTCAAAPVSGPDGQLLGVLDISGDFRSRHPHTFGLVRAAAQMIENRLFEARHGAAMRLRLHRLPEGIGTIAEGVLAIDEAGVIAGANPAGLALLGLPARLLIGQPVTQLLRLKANDLADWDRHRPGEIMQVYPAQGDRLYLRVEPGKTARRVFVPPALPRVTTDAFEPLDSGDTAIRSAIDKARRILGKPIALLLRGESGAGKELFARAFHDAGPRRGKPFVAVNCATLPESLIEAELFGYTPGAFSGARREGSPGRIRSANGGTLFLDEIGDMPLPQQARLLRVLQEREVVPVGGGQPVAVDFVLVCATHRNLKEEMLAGRFRSDLYYRINGLTLMLPPLRDRSDFLGVVARMLHENRPTHTVKLALEVETAFATYAWPGNLRQLANALRTACALLDDDEDEIRWEHLPDDLAEEFRQTNDTYLEISNRSLLAVTNTSLHAISEAAIRHAIALSHGNMTQAARRLGISRNTLYRRWKVMGNSSEQLG